MTFKKIVSTCIAICIMATLAVAMSGCDDLGLYEDTQEYYNSFGDVLLISGTSEDKADYVPYSVKQSFYNEKSREDFIAEEDDVYKRVEYSDYVYMAIPFRSSINMDAIALYLQSQNDVTVYINVFVTDYIPTEWKAIADHVIPGEETGKSPDETSGEETEKAEETEKVEKVYDDPTLDKRVGEITVHLKSGKWSSFVLDTFHVNGTTQKSIEIKKDHYILLQIKNNSGIYVDPQTETELQKAEITMTNLLIRALDIKNETEVQGGE